MWTRRGRALFPAGLRSLARRQVSDAIAPPESLFICIHRPNRAKRYSTSAPSNPKERLERKKKKEIDLQLGMMHEKGDGVTKSARKAIACYELVIDGEAQEEDEDINSRAQFQLALLLLKGNAEEGIKPDVTRAAYLLERVINHKECSPEAFYRLARCYLHGIGRDPDAAKAVQLLYTAAVKDDAQAQLEYALILLYGQHGINEDPTLALSFLKRAAQNGIPAANFYIGQSYHHGKGADRDLPTAMDYYEAGAKQGDPSCLFMLGSFHLTGEPEAEIEPDLQVAFDFYLAAAQRNHPESLVAVGMMYETGEGTQRNTMQARYYYELAALRHNDLRAQLRLGYLYSEEEGEGNGVIVVGRGGEKGTTQSKAIRFFKMAANQGSGEAASELGMLYWKGKGVERNKEAALEWLNKATQLGEHRAYLHLAKIYEEEGTQNNNTQQLEEFSKRHRR